MSIFYVSEARNPPRDISPLTIRGAVALIMDSIGPGGDALIEKIVTLKGNPVGYSDLRATIAAVTPPGQTFVTRKVQGGAIKLWRIK